MRFRIKRRNNKCDCGLWEWKRYRCLVCPRPASDEWMQPNMDVAVIQIGNSDNKLTQEKWSQFVSDVADIFTRWHYPIYFHGCSVGSAPWQNACWVVDARNLVGETASIDILRQTLSRLAKVYKQDSIALSLGMTEMIPPRG